MVLINAAYAVLVAASSLVGPALAHPGEHHDHAEVMEHLQKRSELAAHVQRGLDACQGHPEFEALKRRGLERRAKKAAELRQARGISQDSKQICRAGSRPTLTQA